MLRMLDLFSGIGGFSLAARWAGIETIQLVEIDKFCQKVLQKNFPGVPIHDDIKTFKWTGDSPFILTGGFPCQPFSCAGKRRGKEDDRYLWPEMLRVVSETRPTWVIGENVAGFINMGLDDCISDLEAEGYEVQAFVIPACAVKAPHRRDRVWICAHSLMCEHGTGRGQIRETDGLQGINRPSLRSGRIERTDCHVTDTSNQRLQGCKWAGTHDQRQAAHGSAPECNSAWDEPWLEVATRLCRVDDGVSNRVDRLKALGNAIVPQVAYEIMGVIVEIEREKDG